MESGLEWIWGDPMLFSFLGDFPLEIQTKISSMHVFWGPIDLTNDLLISVIDHAMDQRTNESAIKRLFTQQAIVPR